MNHDLHTGRPERRPVGTIAFPDGADFAPEMTPAQVGAYSTLALAHIGDGVYELMMRTALCAAGLTAVTDLHRETVRRVNAPAQARVAEAIQPALTDDIGDFQSCEKRLRHFLDLRRAANRLLRACISSI